MTVPMKLSDTELPVQDRAWVERVLGADEQLLLVQKPMTSLWKPGYAYRMFFALLWNGTLSLAFLGIVSHWNNAAVRLPLLVCLLLLLPFVLVGVGFLISPWWERALDRRTVYVLTDKRALVLRPSTFRRRPVARSYPLAHDLIKEVREYGRGCGDIVMEQLWAHGGHCIPLGFLFVQNVRELEYAITYPFAGCSAQGAGARNSPAGAPDLVEPASGACHPVFRGKGADGAAQSGRRPGAVQRLE